MNRAERLRTLNPNSKMPQTNTLVRIHTYPANAPSPAGEDAMGSGFQLRNVKYRGPDHGDPSGGQERGASIRQSVRRFHLRSSRYPRCGAVPANRQYLAVLGGENQPMLRIDRDRALNTRVGVEGPKASVQNGEEQEGRENVIADIFDLLWQSTIFSGVAGLVSLC
jgi:hypothetical protein